MAKVIAQEEIAVDSEVKQLTPAIYNSPSGPSASYAIIHAEGGAMRYLVNGQDPNPSLGALFEDGDIVELPTIYHIKDFRIVKAGTDPGKLTVTYET